MKVQYHRQRLARRALGRHVHDVAAVELAVDERDLVVAGRERRRSRADRDRQKRKRGGESS
ncbi:MAG TPA: hypothetical protein VIA19_16415 [Burkholderiales bacterium]